MLKLLKDTKNKLSTFKNLEKDVKFFLNEINIDINGSQKINLGSDSLKKPINIFQGWAREKGREGGWEEGREGNEMRKKEMKEMGRNRRKQAQLYNVRNGKDRVRKRSGSERRSKSICSNN